MTLYAQALDRKDGVLFARAWTPDATAAYAHRPPLTGFDQIVASIRRDVEPLDASQHHMGSFLVGIDGAKATLECYVIAHHIRFEAEGGTWFQTGARYENRAVRTGDGWRLVHLSTHRMWTAGNPRVLEHIGLSRGAWEGSDRAS